MLGKFLADSVQQCSSTHTQIVESEKKCLECAIFITHESATSTFESWKKTNKYLLIDSLNMIITCRVICKKWVAKLQETNVFTPGSKNFKSSAIAEKCTKQTYSLLTARKKISLDKNSLEIQAKRCYFIFNPQIVRSVASNSKFYHLPLENTEYFQRIACLLM